MIFEEAKNDYPLGRKNRETDSPGISLWLSKAIQESRLQNQVVFCIIILLSGSAWSQSFDRKVFSPAGSVFTHNGQEYSYTIGEPMMGTDLLTIPYLTKGFEQPEPLILLPVTVTLHQVTSYPPLSDVLSWSSSQDAGTSHYVIERAVGAGGYVEVRQEQSTGQRQYRTTVSTSGLSGMYRYRIRQVMAGGESWVSNEVELAPLQAEVRWKLFPNPAVNHCFLQLRDGATLPASVRVWMFNQQGALVHEMTVESPANPTLEINLSSFPSGIYLVRVLSEGTLTEERLVVTK